MAYPGFQRGGCLRWPHTKSGGGGSPLQVRYTKSRGGGGGQFASGPIRKVVGGGGGGGLVWHTENTLSLIKNDYNFDHGGGGGAQAFHARANELNCRF